MALKQTTKNRLIKALANTSAGNEIATVLDNAAAYPDQSGNAGKVLGTNGTDVAWVEQTPDLTEEVEALEERVAENEATISGNFDDTPTPANGTVNKVFPPSLNTSDSYSDLAVNEMMETYANALNQAQKEIVTKLNAVIAALKAAGLMEPDEE